jgi:hypothetical protein
MLLVVSSSSIFVYRELNHSSRIICESRKQEEQMPKYVIEREIPGAGSLSTADLVAISQKSCGVLNKLGPSIQWVHSYVVENMIYCVYIAPNAELVREHAKLGGFPANKVSEVHAIIDPTTSEG